MSFRPLTSPASQPSASALALTRLAYDCPLKLNRTAGATERTLGRTSTSARSVGAAVEKDVDVAQSPVM